LEKESANLSVRLSDSAFADLHEHGSSLELDRVGGEGAGFAANLDRGRSSERTAGIADCKSSSLGRGPYETDVNVVRFGRPPVSGGKRHGDKLDDAGSGSDACLDRTAVGSDSFSAGGEAVIRARSRSGERLGSTGASGRRAHVVRHDALREVATVTIKVRDGRNICVYYRLEDRHFIIVKILFLKIIQIQNQIQIQIPIHLV
jgi:hypothetical protein